MGQKEASEELKIKGYKPSLKKALNYVTHPLNEDSFIVYKGLLTI